MILYFDSIDEGESLLLEKNLERCGDHDECKRLHESGDPDFEESLKKDSINGKYFYMFISLNRKMRKLVYVVKFSSKTDNCL